MRLRFWLLAPSFILIFLALLAFGGRTALVAAGVAVGLTTGWIVLSGLLRRTLQLSTIGYIILAAIVLPLLIGYVITQTSIADRIIDTFYVDDSAEVRIIQWHVLNYLSLKNWLFGISMDQLIALKYQVGITGVEDIENFWLLVFLNLGAIGFLTFLFVFGMFLVHVTNYAGGIYGWTLMLVALIIDSGANSLGTKSNDLVIEVAMLIAIAGYRHFTPPVRRSYVEKRMSLREMFHALMISGATPEGLSVQPISRKTGLSR
jgi:hypothetical protein